VSERIEQLRVAVETMHHCKESYETSTPILETFRKQRVCEGVVDSFALTDRPKSKRCYALSDADKGETQYVTVLEIPPVESPITAAKAAMAGGSKK
jgi:hypothetical protein